MAIPAKIDRRLLTLFLGLFSGFLFAFIVGSLDAADYLMEQISIGIVEVPFIILFAVFDRKYGWKDCLFCVFLGIVVTTTMTIENKSILPVVYLKASIMGIILGEASWFEGSFKRRLLAVSLPGIVLSFFFGLPIILKGVNPEVLERFRQDALEMYNTFMSGDEAVNSADNAMQMFRSIFKTGFAVFIISSLIFAWFSFVGGQWIILKFKEEPEYVAPLQNFQVPFHAIWVFLGGFGLLLSEYEPVLPLALNIFVVMAFLYLVQGLAVIIFYMNRFSLGRILRVLFWLFFFITLLFSGILLILTGVIDNWFNFRLIHSSNNISNENNEEN
ncbi:MAG: DUF2232 domain-containing protein [Candidatus Latescibacteria bacterium]|jgi:uncharacterized protein YybS (DUF2232 family)|nr:DUF2232 domain-containing protein [Candidatus Latescibacterota bacterium]